MEEMLKQVQHDRWIKIVGCMECTNKKDIESLAEVSIYYNKMIQEVNEDYILCKASYYRQIIILYLLL